MLGNRAFPGLHRRPAVRAARNARQPRISGPSSSPCSQSGAQRSAPAHFRAFVVALQSERRATLGTRAFPGLHRHPAVRAARNARHPRISGPSSSPCGQSGAQRSATAHFRAFIVALQSERRATLGNRAFPGLHRHPAVRAARNARPANGRRPSARRGPQTAREREQMRPISTPHAGEFAETPTRASLRRPPRGRVCGDPHAGEFAETPRGRVCGEVTHPATERAPARTPASPATPVPARRSRSTRARAAASRTTRGALRAQVERTPARPRPAAPARCPN
jgi:hypothetical protein